MKRIEDERVRFYLRHRAQIDAWAAIADDVPEVAHRFLKTLGRDVKALARALNVRYWPVESAHPKRFLVHPDWVRARDIPTIALGLEWRRADVSFHESPPYVGLWVNKGRTQDAALHERIHAALEPTRAVLGYEATPWWPARRFVPPPEGSAYWDDLDRYREALRSTIRTAWDDLTPEVDGVLGTA